jgi:hypothetical protein
LEINKELLGESGIIMNFNDQSVTWDIDKTAMKDRSIQSSKDALIKKLFI